EVSTTRPAQHGTHPNRTGARVANGRSRRACRQSLAHPVARRDATDCQRAVDRRTVFSLGQQKIFGGGSALELRFEGFEGLVVAASREKMRELRINRRRERSCQYVDLF